MRTILYTTAAILIASPAFATQPPTPPPFQGGNSTSSADAAAKAFQAQQQSTRVNVRNTNVNANVARGGSARSNATGGNAASNATGIGGAGGQGGNSSGASSNTTVSVTGDQDRLQAPAIGIPGIAIGNNCGLGASAGASFAGVGFGGAYSWEGETCRKLAIAASVPNMPDVQLAVMCQIGEFAAAMRTAGRACPGQAPAPAPTAVTAARAAAATAARPECSGPWRGGVMPTGC